MAYVGWTTALILQVVIQEKIDLIAPLATIRQWYWRTLSAGLFGWGILLTASTLELTTGAVSMTIALVLLGITSLIWNLLTAALLPVVLADTEPFWPAVKQSFTISQARMHQWAPLVIAQMVLLGWITFIHVSYTTHDVKTVDSEVRSTTTTTATTTRTNWSVNSIWTGGYADQCKWHETLMESLESKPLESVDRFLTILFAVLAIVVKIKIISDVYTPAPSDWSEMEIEFDQTI